MLGQRIVESFSDAEDTQDTHCLPEPPGGLTIRRLKSAGLRIVTESDALWTEASMVRTRLHFTFLVVIIRRRCLGILYIRQRADSPIYLWGA